MIDVRGIYDKPAPERFTLMVSYFADLLDDKISHQLPSFEGDWESFGNALEACLKSPRADRFLFIDGAMRREDCFGLDVSIVIATSGAITVEAPHLYRVEVTEDGNASAYDYRAERPRLATLEGLNDFVHWDYAPPRRDFTDAWARGWEEVLEFLDAAVTVPAGF